MKEKKISNEELEKVSYSRLATNPGARTSRGESAMSGEKLKERMDEPFKLFQQKFNALVALVGGDEKGDSLIKHIPTGIGENHTLADMISNVISESAEFASYLSVGELTLLEKLVQIDKVLKGHDSHIADRANPHGVTAKQLGLERVDNTSDEEKPLSAAAREALAALGGELSAAEAELIERIAQALISAKSYADGTKVGKVGDQVIEGGLSISGDLLVGGDTYAKQIESLKVGDAVIIANADGVLLSELSGYVIRVNGDSAYAIVYDPADDCVKIGLGVYDGESKLFTFGEGEAQALATRGVISDGHISVWNDAKKTFEDSGFGVGDIHKEIYTIEKYANLFNKDSPDNVLGYVLSSNKPIVLAKYCYSHFIDVEEGATYWWYNDRGYTSLHYRPCFYNDSGTYIATTEEQQSAITDGVWSRSTVPTGLGIVKMRVSGRYVGSLLGMMVIKSETKPNDVYIPYGEAPKLTEKMAAMIAGEAEKAANETINEYHQERDINPNNLFANPIFNGSDKWTLSSTGATIVETDTIVNGLELVASGESATFRQDISTSGLKSGCYVIRCKSTTNNLNCAVQVFGNNSGKTIREGELTRNGDICEVELDIDFEALLEEIPSLYLLRIGFYQYYSTPTVVSEPYFGLSEGEYTGFWNVAYGDAVRRKEFTDLKKVVDAQAEAANPLYGKIITFNGDSICEARATNGGGYATIIGANNNMTVENLGVSGGTIMYAEGKHCISRTVANMREDADYIILEGGVNDLYSDRPLGAMSNGYNATLDDTTFYGAFENMLKQALIRFHGKKIGYIAVHKMTAFFDSDKAEDNAYHAAIKCCAKWGIPVLDLNKTVPPFAYLKNNAETAFMANLYTEDTSGTGVGDGWHPNEEGYRKFYVPKIEAWLKTL